MRFGIFVAALSFNSAVLAAPTWHEWIDSWEPGHASGLEGFALDNPLGPTTGGKGGETITVTTIEELIAAVVGDNPKVIYLDGEIRPSSRLVVGSNTSLLGKGKGANIIGEGINIYNATNVIVRNIGIRFVEGGDGMTVQNSTRVWVDHCEFESEISAELGPDFYVSLYHVMGE